MSAPFPSSEPPEPAPTPLRLRNSDLALLAAYWAGTVAILATPLAFIAARHRAMLSGAYAPMLFLGAGEATFLIGAWLWRMHRGYTWRELGFVAPPLRYVLLGVLGAALAIILQGLIPGASRDLPIVPDVTGLILTLVVAAVIAPLAEELIFRGIIYRWVAERLGFAAGVVLSSLAFAAAHAETDPINFVHLFAIGGMCAFLYAGSRSLWSDICLHATYNATVVLVSFWAVLQQP